MKGAVVHPRIHERNTLLNKYQYTLVIEGDLQSTRNLIKISCFKNDPKVTESETFRVNEYKHIIYYNRGK